MSRKALYCIALPALSSTYYFQEPSSCRISSTPTARARFPSEAGCLSLSANNLKQTYFEQFDENFLNNFIKIDLIRRQAEDHSHHLRLRLALLPLFLFSFSLLPCKQLLKDPCSHLYKTTHLYKTIYQLHS